MGRIFCIANQKGGVGKTTTVINLAASLAAAERRVLLIDMDPQGNATSGLAVAAQGGSVYNALLQRVPLRKLVRATALRFLSVIPATPDLAGAQVELVALEAREYRLKEALKPVVRHYDYVFIDCPPSLGLLTVNALTAADSVLIPLQTEYYAMEGLAQLMTTIELVRHSLNPQLALEGILLTMFDARSNINHQVVAEVKRTFPKNVFGTLVPRNVRLAECPSFGKPVLLYDIKSRGCEAYLAVGQELMRREPGRTRRRKRYALASELRREF